MLASTIINKKVHSFSVFDTCLLRTCGFPSAVLRLTAREITIFLGPDKVTWSEEDFVIHRLRAERLAREQSNNEEITLDEIWKELCKELGLEFNDRLPAIECECERIVLCSNPEILKRINNIRDSGGRIVFISDMYLPYNFIIEELTKHGFYTQADKLYISSEIGLTKYSGTLFKHVLNEEKISPKNLHHIGDKRHSDCKVPLELGINSLHYTGSEFTDFEKKLLLTSQNDSLALMPLVCAMRDYRLASGSSGINQFIGEFLGPVLTLLAQWVLQSAAKNGVDRLYFFSRDCQALSKVSSILSSKHFGIECCYLLVSRQALFLPSAIDCTPSSMPWLFREFEKPTLGSLLAKLELNVNEWLERFYSIHGGVGANYELINLNEQKQFWDILQEPDLHSTILNNIKARRESALQYFESKGLFENNQVNVVDLGWHGTCQSSIKKILDLSGKNITVSGFYLGRLGYDGLPSSITGPMKGLFEQKPSDDPFNKNNHPVFRHITKIEHILGISDHPSVFHYQDGRPTFQLLDNTDLIQSVGNNISHLHKEVERFAEMYALTKDKFDIEENLIRECVSITLKEFWSNPAPESLKLFSTISASVDQNNLNAIPLVSPYTYRQAFRKLLPRRWFSPPPEPGDKVAPWQEASYKLSPKSIKFLIKFKIYSSRFKNKLKTALLG